MPEAGKLRLLFKKNNEACFQSVGRGERIWDGSVKRRAFSLKEHLYPGILWNIREGGSRDLSKYFV